MLNKHDTVILEADSVGRPDLLEHRGRLSYFKEVCPTVQVQGSRGRISRCLNGDEGGE